jgi:radical SAM superfamily enzyme YgiQ (UPF0313 family)
MKVLFIYPQCPDTTFWSFKTVLWKFLRKKTAFSPLGLLTVAAMLPKIWRKKLIDLNRDPVLRDADIAWADLVMISAMIIQKESAKEAIRRCKVLGKTVVVGGPLFSGSYKIFTDNYFVLDEAGLIADFPGIDHFVLDEAEITLPPFLKDLERGQAKKIYTAAAKPNLWQSPVPDWSLIKLPDYTTASIQFSRGCPYDCDFCCVHEMLGRKMRAKSSSQIIAELNALYLAGYRGSIFFVDDNFVGLRAAVKEVLRAVIKWQEEHNFPFDFLTQASVDMSDDEELLELMRRAGFKKVFLGIETTNIEGLRESHKMQNVRRNLKETVKIIHRHGIQVMAGMIVGFDADTPKIFDEMFKFLQEAGIITAMVNMLTILPGTKLWVRMKAEGRLLSDTGGDSVSAELNFKPTMGSQELSEGYRRLLLKLYQPKHYYRRLRQMMKDLRAGKGKKISFSDVRAFCQSLWRIGIFSRSNWRYFKLLLRTSIFKRRSLPAAVEAAIIFVHYNKLSRQVAKKIAKKYSHPQS